MPGGIDIHCIRRLMQYIASLVNLKLTFKYITEFLTTIPNATSASIS